jgi:sortase A
VIWRGEIDMAAKAPIRKRSRPRIDWRRLALATVAAIVLGIAAGAVVYRVSPARVESLANAVLRRNTGGAPTTGTPVPGAITPPPQVSQSLEQLNTTLTSYQVQPSDLHTQVRLIIPAIKVNAPIVDRGLVDGWMVVAPGNFVTHFVYSAFPGSSGNAILYSHDGTVFRHLDSLAVGDTILVQTPQGTLQFHVRELRIIAPTDLSVLDATQTPVLTLLTCYPYGIDSSRLAIIADLES